MTLKITPISAFSDNYIWMLINTETKETLVVDPGDAQPVIDVCLRQKLNLTTILLTHHHFDHVGGVSKLVKKYNVSTVYGPKSSQIKGITHQLKDNDKLILNNFGLTFEVFEIPGHTLDHIAYYGNQLLFCGDTLFSAGCGKLFEGTPEQMLTSLNKLASLPDNTRAYPAHEYTLSNLRFAKMVEPGNQILLDRLEKVQSMRANNEATLPTTMAIEKETNPFLRIQNKMVKKNIQSQTNIHSSIDAEVFAALRRWKDVAAY